MEYPQFHLKGAPDDIKPSSIYLLHKAPFSWPNSSLSKSSLGIALLLERIAPRSFVTSSAITLLIPVSPNIRAVLFVSETFLIKSFSSINSLPT